MFYPMRDNQDGHQNVWRLMVCTCGHSNLVIYHQISSEFHLWITFTKLYPKINCRICLMNMITKMAAKMATACQFTYGHSRVVIYYPILSKFHLWTTFINLLFKPEYGICLTSNNQDGHQNGRCLSDCVCGHSNLVNYHLISSKFHI